MSILRKKLAIVVVSDGNDFTDVIGTRGFSGPGASKIKGAYIAGTLAYRTAKYAYQRYFNYATKTTSRTRGTATEPLLAEESVLEVAS